MTTLVIGDRNRLHSSLGIPLLQLSVPDIGFFPDILHKPQGKALLGAALRMSKVIARSRKA